MSTIESLLTDLGGRNISLRRKGDRLLVNAPKGAMTAELSARIRTNKAAIMDFLASVGTEQEEIQKAPHDLPPVLSFAQQRMWFLDQLEQDEQGLGGSHYNIPLPLRLQGDLNLKALERTITAISSRHEPLRSRFPVEQGEPILVIEPVTQIQLPITDLSGEADPTQAARAQIFRDAATGFNMATGPLFRCKLFLLGKDDYVFLANMHHIISDGWSNGLLVQELAQHYAYFSQSPDQTESPLPPLNIQYSDFAYWQQQRLSGEVKSKQIDYWEKTLEGIPSLHQIPLDHQRPRVMTYRGGREHLTLDESLSQSLKDLAKAQGISLFMLLEAAFATLLHRYSGQTDIILGSPIANRNFRQLEPIIGLFVNTLVMRNNLSGDPKFSELLQRTKAMALAAYDHQDIPFEQILEVLDPERNLSYSPVFQVMFSLVNTPSSELKLPGLELGGFSLGLETAKFDLNLTMGEHGNHLTATMEYCTDLFEKRTIKKMLAHFVELLQAVGKQPEQTISRLSLLTHEEREQLLVRWNQTQRIYPKDRCIHQLFEDQAARTPDALAICDDDASKTYTYTELNAWADDIAQVLRRKGVGPWVRVGLMVERSAEMIAGIYGILKAGGAYVPIDPTYPAERIAFILGDCGAQVLLTKSAWRDQAPQTGTEVLFLDEPLPRIETPMSIPPAQGDHLIYIIYTSGSTGTPKGAGVFHRSFVNMVHWFVSDFDLTDQDRVLLTSSVSFDLTQKNMYAPLLVGGSLHLAPPSPYDPRVLVDIVNERRITWLNCTPSAFYPLIEDSGPQWAQRLQSLRWVFLGGEPISIARLNPWLTQEACRAVVVNTYGPTECTDISNFWSMPDPQVYLNRPTPIGKAIYNVKLLVLDHQLGLLPPGGLGELCIFGDSVGPGYLNDPALTAQKFVPNPHATQAGDRMYRTGDLVRYLPGGEIEFNGRIDHQIKVRGFRVELGEIETALIKHDAVREAVALIKEHMGDKHIVSYLLLEDHIDETPDFDHYLGDKLPEYMIPSFILCLEALPLTPSGKIDRKALTAMALPEQQADAYSPPETEQEEAIAAIFEAVLGQQHLSVTTSFFRLGGHSLLATKVMSRIRENLDVDLPLQALFEAPTVRGLAALVSDAGARQDVPMVPVARDAVLPLSFSQERLWFLYQLEGKVSTYNMPVGFRVRGPLKLDLLQKAYSDVVARHENLRTTFCTLAEVSQLIIHPATPQTIAFEDISHLEAEAKTAYADQFRNDHGLMIFDLETGPLHKLSSLKMGDQDHMLFLNMHHIVSDGWSESLFMQEMIAFYTAYEQNQALPIPPLDIQYADYAYWQRQCFDGDGLDSQIAYWKQQLGDEPPPLSLPTDFPRPAIRTFSSGSLHANTSPATGKMIGQLAANEDATLFMALLAGFYHLLARHSGMDDVTVGTPIAGRSRHETEPLIGMFLNTLVLRADLADDTYNFIDLLKQVRQITLDAYANQDVPFEKLLEVINPERDMSRTPLFQVFFNMLNMPRVEGNPNSELQFEQLGNPEIGSKFDLTLYVAETPSGAIVLSLHYNADLFEQTHMQLFLDQYLVLLDKLAHAPHQPMGQFSLVSTEQQQMLPNPLAPLSDSWEGPVFGPMANFAQEEPDRIAVRGRDLQMTYAELEQSSNRLAHGLQAQGLGKGQSAVIYAARCPALVVAMIGVLKTGATITMLDPAYPVDRLAYYVDAIEPQALICLEEAGPAPAALNRPITITLNPQGSAASLEGQPTTLPPLELGPNDPACITFTSGSTGKPKGIIGRHGSLTHFMPWLTEAFEFNPSDRFSLLSGLAHDPLQRDVFTPLWLGATICVPHTDVIGPGLLFDWMQTEAISVAHLTPAMARIVMERDDETKLETLRLAFVTGDVLTHRDVARLQSIAQHIDVVNFYGTTETQRAVGYSRASQSEAWHREAMPLGRGMPDVQLLVIRGNQQLAAFGEIGEIHVRSPHLALGYLNHPELTSERFIANPFNATETHSVYRTGDLGYYLPDGRVAFAGRADHQVQIRGYRIEIPEIEGALAAQDRVDEAAVLYHEPGDQDPFLVAYLQTQEDDSETLATDIRENLKKRLPSFMIPSYFLALKALPLTPNGKLDKAALRKLALPTATVSSSGSAPRTPAEEVLAAIWQEVLNLDFVPREGNFFNLGGHSLSATRVITRIRDAFDVLLPLRAIFEAPTLESLAARIDSGIREDHQEPPLLPQDRNQTIPLSLAQTRLWFIDRFDSESASYSMHFALRLEGPFHHSAMEQALTAIYERHEILRTQFYEQDGEGFVRFRPPETYELQTILVKEEDVDRYVQNEANHRFDLLHDKLFRATLLQLGDAHHILLLTLHHIIGDGWSLGILSEELAHYYYSFSKDTSPKLKPLPIQYGDFALWQKRWLTDAVLESQLGFWRQTLEAAPSLLDLPTDRPRPSQQTFDGSRFSFVLESHQTEKLKALASKQGVTMFMLLESLFALQLSRYSHQEDVVIGTPIANRNRVETESLIGLFVNTLVIRNDLSGNPPFSDYLMRIRQTALDAYAHQDVPFEKVIDAVNPERSLSFSPLFQVMFVLQNLPPRNQVDHELKISHLSSPHLSTEFDLSLVMADGNNQIAGTFEYNTTLFDHDTIVRMSRHFGALIDSVIADPDQPIGDLEMIEASESHQLIHLANATERDIPFEKPVHHFFEIIADTDPDRYAIINHDGQTLSFGELNLRANQLAWHLKSMGIGLGDRVALFIERSPDLLVGLLGIIKSGAAYIPVDPGYPEHRIHHMLDDSQANLVLTVSSLTAKLPNRAILNLDTVAFKNEHCTNLNLPTLPHQALFLIYTSGSTGKPKASVNTHRGIVNLNLWYQSRYPLSAGDRTGMITPFSFDVSTWEITWSLMAGATLVIADPKYSAEPQYQREWIQREKLTGIHLVPSMLKAFLDNLGDERFQCSLRYLFVGGEASTRAMQQRVLDHMSGPNGPLELFNGYGPSEAAVFATAVSIGKTVDTIPISIGNPIANVKAYVVNPQRNLQPIGAPGELVLAGTGVGWGYFGKPRLTAARFIPNPFATDPSHNRLYLTGDLVRRLSTGETLYLDRIDAQVKLRGIRVELGEIEAMLSLTGRLLQSRVVMDKAPNGSQRLVAFYQAKPHASETIVQELRTELSQNLPSFMVPASFVSIEAWPHLPNGKINRKALIKMARDQATKVVRDRVLPATETEKTLHGIWSSVLPTRQFGVTDSFFEIGGDSILSLRIIARARTHGLQIHPKQIFQYPTIRQLAKAIAAQPIIQIDAEQGFVSGAMPLMPIQQWFLNLDWKKPGHFNQSLLFSLDKAVEPSRLKAAFEKVLLHHDALRLRFVQEADQWQAFHSEEATFEFQMADLSQDPHSSDTLSQLAEDLQARGDLEQGPLLRVLFCEGCPEDLPNRSKRLLVVIHHLVVDGISWRIFLEDLGQAYLYPEAALPEKTTSFKSWSQRLHGQPISQEEHQWWQDHLSGKLESIPFDFKDTLAKNPHAKAKTYSKVLDKQLTEHLLTEVHKPYRTQMDDVLLTALLEAAHQQFGMHSLLVDLESHGREGLYDDVDLSRTIGWFTSIYPVRLLKEPDATIVDTLKLVKENRRQTPNKGIGFGLLQQLQHKFKDLPQADIVFNYLGQTGETQEGSDLFGPAKEFMGARRSPEDERLGLIELDAIVIQDQLRMTWTYPSERFKAETIAALADAFVQSLDQLITHCTSPHAGGFTPSDFPLATLSQSSLDRLLEGQPTARDIYPLSPMQEGMFFHALAQPKSGNYFEQSFLHLEGDFEPKAFATAWHEAINRYDILRTSFHLKGLARPLQVVHPPFEPPIHRLDWRHVAEDDLPKKLQTLLQEDKQQGFSLDTLPLMRLTLVQCANHRWHILWSFHHMLLDGWSSAILFREVMVGYNFAMAKQTPEFPSPRPYRDYIAYLESQDSAAIDTFWSQSLGGFSETTPLPFSKLFDPSTPRRLEAVEHIMPATELQDLEKVAHSQGITVFTLVQAAWAIALGANSQRDDVVFGTIVSGRPSQIEDVESMVGLFINALPVRIYLNHLSLGDWLSELQSQNLARDQVAHTPLVEAQKHAALPPGSELFESLLVYENYPAPGSDSPPGKSSIKIHSSKQIEQTHFPMVLIAVPGTKLRLKLGFDTRRFDSKDMNRLLDQVGTILKEIVAGKQKSSKALATAHTLIPRLGQDSNLTENQMLIWMGQTLDPKDLSYHNLITFTLKGAIDETAFGQAFRRVVEASDAMRTVFVHDTGTPQRKVLETLPSQLQQMDFSETAAPQQAFQTWMNIQKTTVLNLEVAAYRSTLCKLAADHYVWFINLHQLIGDGEALSALYEHVYLAYEQYRQTGQIQNLSLPQYERYVEDEAAYQTSKQFTRDRRFWQQKLQDDSESLSFYGQQPTRTTAETAFGDHYLEAARVDQLDTWLNGSPSGEANHQARLNFFLATLAIYLAKVSGRKVVTIGLPIHNRRSKGYKRTLGSFMHALPLRVRVDANITISDLMQRIAKLSFEALRYGRAALANSKQDPLYDVMVNYHLSRFPDFAGIPMDFAWVHPGSGHLALTLQISDFEIQGGLKLGFEMNGDCFVEPHATRAMAHYLHIIESCLAKPHTFIRDILVGTEAEHQAFQAFNLPNKPFPANATLLQQIAARTLQFPERTAVVGPHRQFSFEALADASDRLARQLISEGIGCEDRVGICLHKSVDLMTTILGVLKTGAAYVPLDPSYPEDRLAYMLSDCGATKIISHSSLAEVLPKTSADLWFLDQVTFDSASFALPEIHADQAAYVVYTSGSTGRPKGVVVTHRAWHNAYRAWETAYELHHGATVHLQMAGFSFDVFAGDLVRALCSGGTLVLVDKQQLLDPAELYALIETHQVTHAEFVPAVLRHLADYVAQAQLELTSIQVLPAGSDSWFTDEYLRFRALLPASARLINSYGVSEATIDSSLFESSTDDLVKDRSVPIGKPFANMQLYVLDSDLQLAPVGVPGELLIGGEGLARCYWNQPALTAERFIPNPFGVGSRLYRTGDAARHLPDSMDLEFLGRMDLQVKIRGFRVEPGEIEGVLSGLEGIQNAIVMVRDLNGGEKQLVAHIQPSESGLDADTWITRLKNHTQANLPEHMIPAHFDVLQAMPLTPNGKLDRKALAKRAVSSLVSVKADPPRNEAEARMVQIWEKVLGKQPIGIHANFFDLGGHSLTAVRLLAQCREHFQRPLQLPELFNHATPAKLVALLENNTPAIAHPVLLQPKGDKTPLFLVHAVGGGVSSYLPMAEAAKKDRPIYAIHADFHRPETDLVAMATQYVKLIKHIVPNGPFLLSGWSMGGTVAFEMARQLRASGEEVPAVVLIDSMPSDQMGLGDHFGEPDIMASYVNQLAAGVPNFSVEAETLREIPADHRLAFVMEQAKQVGLLPEAAELDQLQTQWEMFRRNSLASYHYRPQVMSGSIHLIQAAEKDHRIRDLADNGWGHLVDEVIVHQQPGNHMTMVREPHVQQLNHTLESLLEDLP